MEGRYQIDKSLSIMIMIFWGSCGPTGTTELEGFSRKKRAFEKEESNISSAQNTPYNCFGHATEGN
jgi:predicted DNA-binding WGR domain protein